MRVILAIPTIHTPSFKPSGQEVLMPPYNAFQHAVDHSVIPPNGCEITSPSQEKDTIFFTPP